MRNILLIAFLLFAWTASAQETFLPYTGSVSVGNSIIDMPANGAGLDGQSATIPSPEATSGYYQIVYDLGFTQPANTPLIINVYGSVPAGSNLYVCSVYDYAGEGFAHNQTLREVPTTRGDNMNKPSRITLSVQQWTPFRYISLIRESELSSTGNGFQSAPQNGKPVLVDAVSISVLTQPKNAASVQYGRWRLHSGVTGMKTLQRN